MNGLSKFLFLNQASSSLRGIRARTWAILAVTISVIIGLLVWTVIALLSWLWEQAPAATEAGGRLAGEAASMIGQAAPAVKERAEQWVPGLRGELARWLPGAGENPQTLDQTLDVSGADIGPVPRYPGLARIQFAREGQFVEVRYAGRAKHEAVLAHFVQGFAAAGYKQEVISATSEVEQHRFLRGQETFDLSITGRPGGRTELHLRQSAEQ